MSHSIASCYSFYQFILTLILCMLHLQSFPNSFLHKHPAHEPAKILSLMNISAQCCCLRLRQAEESFCEMSANGGLYILLYFKRIISIILIFSSKAVIFSCSSCHGVFTPDLNMATWIVGMEL